MFRAWAFVAVALTATLSFAATPIPIPLQRPAPSRGNTQTQQEPDAGQKAQDTGTHERGTENAPLFVQIAQPDGHEAITTKAEDEPHGYTDPDWWVAGATIALAVVTGGLWWVTYLLWSSTKRLVMEERANKRIELRAYLSATARGIALEGDFLRAYVEIQNGGGTPAFNVTIPAIWDFKPPPPHAFQVAEAGETEAALANLATFTLPKGGIHTLSPKSKIVDRAQLIAGAQNQRFYVFGLITYKDVFGDIHWAEFCAFLEGDEFLAAFACAENNPGGENPCAVQGCQLRERR